MRPASHGGKPLRVIFAPPLRQVSVLYHRRQKRETVYHRKRGAEMVHRIHRLAVSWRKGSGKHSPDIRGNLIQISNESCVICFENAKETPV